MSEVELFVCNDDDDDGTDSKTFEALYHQINPKIRAFVFRSEPYEADDICAEVWLALVRYMPRFRGDAEGFEDLAYRIARRRLIDHRRRRMLRKTDPTAHESMPDLPSPDEPEADVLARLRSTAAYEYLLDMLTPEQVDVVVLRIIQGISPGLVGEKLGRSPGSVRIMHYRALKRLREDPDVVEGVAGA